MMSYSDVVGYQHFRGPYCLHLQCEMFMHNVCDVHVQDPVICTPLFVDSWYASVWWRS